MFDLNASLGLGEVEADPNLIPDGSYDGKVLKSEYVLSGNKKVAHVLTYQVTEGQYKGAQRQHWNNLGENALDANGQPAEKIADVASFTPTMTDQSKTYYKKLWLDLGIDTDQVAANPADLVGKPITFGVKRNGQYLNINFVQLRQPVAGFGPEPVAASEFSAPTTAADLSPNPFDGPGF